MADQTRAPSMGRMLDGLMQSMRETISKVEQLAPLMTDAVGESASEDGLVRVRCTSDDPVAELRIDPRAMSLGSEALARLLQEQIRAAQRDLARARLAQGEGAFGTDLNPLDAARLDRLHEDAQQMGRDTEERTARLTDIVEDMKRRMGDNGSRRRQQEGT